MLGGFGAYGLCVYMQDGKEYDKIFPVLDWGCMPGTTTPDVELPLEIGGIHESEFVGSVSDGMYGLSAMDQHKTYIYDGENVAFGGRFAYFFLDEGVLHLGNHLYCNCEKEYHTTLDQCLLKGPVLSDGEVVKEDSIYHYFTPNAVAHNGKLYLNLDRHEWKIKAGKVKGSYTRIFHSDSIPKQEVTDRTFTLVMPHDKDDDQYCYAVLPAAGSEEAETILKELPFEILLNGSVQAVRYKNRIFAVFYEATALVVDGQKLTVDAPCMVIWQPEDRKLLLSTPDKEKEQINVVYQDQHYKINMPQDIRYRGCSVEVAL